MGALADLGSILRSHILLIAMTAAVVFGWLFSGAMLVAVAALGGLDWLLINLLNRISDTEEDLANDIRGASQVAQAPRKFVAFWLLLQAVSLAVGFLLYPELTPWRLLVQLIGVGYSYRMVPTWSGMRRFKDIYFAKNFMSALLFVLTVFCYPLVVLDWAVRLPGGWPAVALLVLFFLLFEITYEILYDMRDLEGDQRVGVPTYPVVHGMLRSRQIVDALLLAAVVVLLLGLASGILGVREGLFLAAPAVQFFFYRPRYRRGLTSSDCIGLTHVGTAMLLVYLAGTQLWLQLGLPENIFLR